MLLSNVRESLIEDWYKMINVNLVGVLNMTFAILSHMKNSITVTLLTLDQPHLIVYHLVHQFILPQNMQLELFRMD